MIYPYRRSPLPTKLVSILFLLSLSACGGGSDSTASSAAPDAPAGSSQTSAEIAAIAPPQPPGIIDSESGAVAPLASPATSPALAAAATAAPATSTAPAWNVTALGTLDPAVQKLKDINNNGAVVGYTTQAPSGSPSLGRIPYQDPFILQNGQLTSLGNLGGAYGSASDINDAGQIAGYSYAGGVGQTHAFFYHDGVMDDIGILLDPNKGSWAQAINSSGQVAVYTDAGTYVYSNGNMTKKTDAPDRFMPAALNDSGQMAGTRLTEGAAAYYDGSALHNLGALLTTTYSLATGLNNAGQVIGVGYGTDGNDYRAFLYGAGTMTQLTAADDVQSYATSINNTGEVVGWFESADQQWHAFMYRNGQRTDLNSLPGVAASGWVLDDALRVNDAGQILASGTLNGKPGYCLLTPPT